MYPSAIPRENDIMNLLKIIKDIFDVFYPIIFICVALYVGAYVIVGFFKLLGVLID